MGRRRSAARLAPSSDPARIGAAHRIGAILVPAVERAQAGVLNSEDKGDDKPSPGPVIVVNLTGLNSGELGAGEELARLACLKQIVGGRFGIVGHGDLIGQNAAAENSLHDADFRLSRHLHIPANLGYRSFSLRFAAGLDPAGGAHDDAYIPTRSGV